VKIAILNDTHFGARNDSSVFLDYFLSFFENQFFPYLENHDIKNILHLGDFMDRRKYVNFNTLSILKDRFFNTLRDYNFHMVLGNHDTFYRNTNKINSASELFGFYDFFNLYENPTTLCFDGLKIGMVPWICSENKDKVLDYIRTCDAPILCGHFELSGYEVLRGMNFFGGMDDGFLSRFEKVLSGHFHIKSNRKNVHYLGTQYQMTFADLDDIKGFHVIDTETRELEFIENPENKPDINHIDGDKKNNRVDNIEWCTKVENARHSRDVLKSACYSKGYKSIYTTLTKEDRDFIITNYKSRDCEHGARPMARKFGVHHKTILKVLKDSICLQQHLSA